MEGEIAIVPKIKGSISTAQLTGSTEIQQKPSIEISAIKPTVSIILMPKISGVITYAD
jgi:hypothetical protein